MADEDSPDDTELPYEAPTLKVAPLPVAMQGWFMVLNDALVRVEAKIDALAASIKR